MGRWRDTLTALVPFTVRSGDMTNWAVLAVLAALVWRGGGAVQRELARRSPRARLVGALLWGVLKLLVALGAAEQSGVDVVLFLKLFAAGGTCALLTHSLTTPLDVLRTKMQLEPDAYPTTLGGLRKIVKEDGPSMLLQGLGATATGYFMHGALKYASYEQLRLLIVYAGGIAEGAPVPAGYYVLAAIGSEVVASTALCPLEAVRIRMVSDRSFAGNFWEGLTKLMHEGVYGMYKGWLPLITKQCPYTAAQFWSYELSLSWMRAAALGTEQALNAKLPVRVEIGLSLAAGVISGTCAAVASQPGDTILSRINKHGEHMDGWVAGGVVAPGRAAWDGLGVEAPRPAAAPRSWAAAEGEIAPSSPTAAAATAAFLENGRASSVQLNPGNAWLPNADWTLSHLAAAFRQMTARMQSIAHELGVRGLFLGLLPRCAQVALIVTGQFLLYGSIKALFGVPQTMGHGAMPVSATTAAAAAAAPE
ncbi:hypothetical protein CDCA_CDCA05G1677 [Cyanidium caldarium]|uniref:Uncharacterized protein n=1 Tax=Cyanidium caldarium TaxID=2771 RepID=A0AAV9ITJ5_CYACA|nr:hypothetical protein CDCA_CDCA05G1677 [Cyanidium caldarium]